jgi:hypothetical protein
MYRNSRDLGDDVSIGLLCISILIWIRCILEVWGSGASLKTALALSIG